MSEQYEGLLQDYCMQRNDEFLQGQVYLCLLVALLIVFSATSRDQSRRARAGIRQGTTSSRHHKTTSGKLVASQHEANVQMDLSSSHDPFQFATTSCSSASRDSSSNTLFLVTIICAPIYFLSLLLHQYGPQNGLLLSPSVNRDMLFSLTMVLIAFIALVGIFLPILVRIHRYGNSDGRLMCGTPTRPKMVPNKQLLSTNIGSTHSNSSAFAMFPEFSPTGLRRPSSLSGESSSGAGSRRPFARTKESRRNMGAVLANLDPTTDSLHNLGLYESSNHKSGAQMGDSDLSSRPIDAAALNLKLNVSANDQLSPTADDYLHQDHLLHHQHQHQHNSARRLTKAEKRLIMLDVDPCCPRHGIGASGATNMTSNGKLTSHRKS